MKMPHRVVLSISVCITLLYSHPAFAQFSQQGPKLVATGGNFTHGYSVSLSADGNTAIVGGQNGPGAAAWVWTRSGNAWAQQGPQLSGTGAVGPSVQGSSVSISADGNTAIVGGRGDNTNTGAAWIWTRNGDVWTQQGAKLVGAGAVGSAQQGHSVALSADGDTAVIGGWLDNNFVGAAWVWTRSGSVWTQQGTKLVGSGSVGSAQQGYSVSVSGDGNTALVGGNADNGFGGAVWVWTRSGGVWTQQGTKLLGSGGTSQAEQGYSVALSSDSHTAIVGGFGDSYGPGAAWVWTRSAGVWSQQGTKLVGPGAVGSANQGHSVSISADGNTAIVGGDNDNSKAGAAWVWTRSGGVWVQSTKLIGTGAVGTAYQGRSVALSADGNTAMVGGPYDANYTGAAWAFTALPTGTLQSFAFTPIASPQAAGVPFNITIRAKNLAGGLAPFSGDVRLDSSVGDVSPTTCRMTNAIAQCSVKVNLPGTALSLGASGGGASGASPAFDVTAPPNVPSTGSLYGRVTDGAGNGIAGADVSATTSISSSTGSRLQSDSELKLSVNSVQSNEQGYYRLSNLPGGQTSIAALLNGKSSRPATVDVQPGLVTTAQLFLETCAGPGELTPILLIPGIMGSSLPLKLVPEVPAGKPVAWDKWKDKGGGIWDFAGGAGWGDLIKKLEALSIPGTTERYKLGCTIFEVPYDWRLPAETVARDYLKKWIERAKELNPGKTGSPKVNIVAHSTGGLVARAYIEGQDWVGDGDIEKLALVATPNRGAAKAYLLWEGGDPWLGDAVDGGVTYGLVARKIYEASFKGSGLKSVGSFTESLETRRAIYHILHKSVLELADLLPTEPFLRRGDSPAERLDCERNETLLRLNNPAVSNLGRLGALTPEPGRVQTKIFAGNTGRTLSGLRVGAKNCGTLLGSSGVNLYRDGWPKITRSDTSSADYADGDGTVTLESARLDTILDPSKLGTPCGSNSIPPCAVPTKNVKHMELIGAYRDEIISFLTGVTPSAAGVRQVANSVTTAPSILTVSLSGRAQPYLTNASGQHIGVEPDSGAVFEEIPIASLALLPKSATIEIGAPANGLYELKLRSAVAQEYHLQISLTESERTTDKSLWGFNHANARTLTFSVSGGGTDPVVVDQSPARPSGLQASATGSAPMTTTLSWTASTDVAVTGYNIYARLEDEPNLVQVGTATSPPYETGDLWASTGTTPVRIYAVAAITAGSETFLSDFVKNDDRDHDGLSDADETLLSTDPAVADSDRDGLPDGEEVLRGTNPNSPDTDGDGESDGSEVALESDPLDSSSVPTPTGLQTPSGLRATAMSATAVTLSWIGSAGAAHYEIVRRVDGGAFEILTTVQHPATSYSDSAVLSSKAYVYNVRAVAAAGASPYSSADLATTVVFTEDPLIARQSAIRASDVLEMRTAVNAVRSTAGLAPAVWSGGSLTPRSTSIQRSHVTELRIQLVEALNVLGLPIPSFTDPSLATGMPVKATHVQELRTAVK